MLNVATAHDKILIFKYEDAMSVNLICLNDCLTTEAILFLAVV